jgi:NAD(P)-dependent dehydrogenase (short-subunit alcohol dehydrogenase family)
MGTVDRVVLITGATGPLGRAAAAAFAADGARLGLVGTDAGRLDALATDLALAEDVWVPAVADLTEQAAARDAVALVEARFGRIDVLLHFVGGWTGGTTLVDLDPDVLAGMLDQHVWSTFHVAQAVVPGMLERGRGRIVAVTSTATAAPGPKAAPYVTAKAAQEALLRVLAREVAGDGITVNLLAVKAIDAKHERDAAPSPRTAEWTTPEELVAAIRFLCSDEAAAISGTRIALDRRG